MIYKDFDSMPLVIEVRDVSDTLKIGRNKTYELLATGKLSAIKVGNHYKILRDSFIEFLKSGT
ncbi:MAG: helix-turn-helix domain-containing protein [Ruminococcaceae bacterium]|nr:helix-turn-helix domain-containing protein [Oscillospiraceae bacterium]